jgi:hypothetical protein
VAPLTSEERSRAVRAPGDPAQPMHERDQPEGVGIAKDRRKRAVARSDTATQR